MHSNSVHIVGYASDGREVEVVTLSDYDYYENMHRIRDDPQYCAKMGIRRLVGKIFGDNGQVECEMEALLDERGRRLWDKEVYTTGEVFERYYDPETGREV